MASKKNYNFDVGKLSERQEGWFRIVVLIVTGIILEVWGYLIVVLAILNWLIGVVSGKRSRDIAMLCEYWNTEIYKYFRYLTGVTNERPFPFSNVEQLSKFQK